MQSIFRLSLTGSEEIVTNSYRVQACFCLGQVCFREILSSERPKQSSLSPCVSGVRHPLHICQRRKETRRNSNKYSSCTLSIIVSPASTRRTTEQGTDPLFPMRTGSAIEFVLVLNPGYEYSSAPLRKRRCEILGLRNVFG